MQTHQQGRSMIEMLGVLAIVGVLSVGGIAGYTKAMSKYKNDLLMSQLSELVINARSLFLQQTTYSGLTTQVLIKSGIVPNTMLASPSTNEITHALNGKVTVFPSKDTIGQIKAMEIYASGLTSSACQALATMDWGSDPASGFVSLYISSGEDEITAPQMEDIHYGVNSIPEDGIFVIGSTDITIPLTPPQAIATCDCPARDCIIGLKYN